MQRKIFGYWKKNTMITEDAQHRGKYSLTLSKESIDDKAHR